MMKNITMKALEYGDYLATIEYENGDKVPYIVDNFTGEIYKYSMEVIRMIKSIDMFVELETGDHIATVEFSDGVGMEYTFDIMTKEISESSPLDNNERITGIERNLNPLKYQVIINKYFKFFDDIITGNIFDNISRIKLYFYDYEEIAFESWESYDGLDNIVGIRTYGYKPLFGRVIKNTSKITVNNYKTIKDTDVVEITNLLPSHFIRRSLSED